MRILQLTNKFPYPPIDGGSIATLSLSRSFARIGAEVSILAMNTKKHYFPPEKLPDDLKNEIKFHTVDIDTQIRILPLLINLIFSRRPYNAQRFINKEYNQALSQLLTDQEFDVIQLEGLYLAPYIETIRKFSKAIISMRSHNIEHEIWERTLPQQSGLRKLYIKNLSRRIRWMEQKYLNDMDVVVPITDRDRKKLESMGCTLPVKVISTGVDSDKIVPTTDKVDFPSVFHIGALDWLPNQEGLLWFVKNVWPSLNNNYPDLKFYIAGRNAPTFIANLKERGLVFLGEVEDAYEFMNSKAIMVVPLLSGSGMRIKIVEGMALEKAIVSTTIGAEGIPVSDRKNILIANSKEEMINAISQLVEDKNICRKIGKNAYGFVKENFDNLAIASSLIKFYEDYQG